MILPPFSLLGPGTKKSALFMLDKYRKKIKVIAGGTELVVLMKLGLLTAPYIMSLRAIKGLKGITNKKSEVIIKSATSIKEIIQSPLMNDMFKGIVRAAKLIAAPPIQNRATIGGNILQNTRCIYYNQSELFRKGLKPCYKAGGNACHAVKGGKRCFSVYQGDIAPALISFGSKVKLEKKDSCRTILVTDLFTGKGENPFSIQDNELLTEVIIPLPDGKYGSSYEKLRIRKGLEYPLASAAVFLSQNKDGRIDCARIVIGAAGSAPRTIEKVTPYLRKGNPSIQDMNKIADLAEELTDAVNNLAVPAAYRRKMVKVLTKRSLTNALQNMGKED